MSKVKSNIKENIGIIKIDNNNKKNALDNDVITLLVEKLRNFDKDSGIHCILIGAEGSVFCAGGDVKAMKAKTDMFSGDSCELQSNYEFGIQEIARVIERVSTPIIGVINGAAVGAGVDFACMTDLRVGNKNSSFSETFGRISLVPGDGGTFFLPRVVGYSKAMEMFLTAKKVSSVEAKEIGLLNVLIDDDQDLWETSINLAKKIAKNSYHSNRFIKKSLKLAWETQNLNGVLDQLSAFQGIVQDTDDHKKRLNKI